MQPYGLCFPLFLRCATRRQAITPAGALLDTLCACRRTLLIKWPAGHFCPGHTVPRTTLLHMRMALRCPGPVVP